MPHDSCPGAKQFISIYSTLAAHSLRRYSHTCHILPYMTLCDVTCTVHGMYGQSDNCCDFRDSDLMDGILVYSHLIHIVHGRHGWKLQARRASPCALLVTHEALTLALPDKLTEPHARRAQALGTELVANQMLAGLDFIEGVECAVGHRKGETPCWRHGSVEEALADEGTKGCNPQAGPRAQPAQGARPAFPLPR